MRFIVGIFTSFSLKIEFLANLNIYQRQGEADVGLRNFRRL